MKPAAQMQKNLNQSTSQQNAELNIEDGDYEVVEHETQAENKQAAENKQVKEAAEPRKWPFSMIDALSILLVHPIQNNTYNTALEMLSSAREFDEQIEEFLTLVFNDNIPELPLKKAKLQELPNLFNPNLAPIEYDLIDTTLRKMANKNLLSKEHVLDFFREQLAKAASNVTLQQDFSNDTSRILLTMVNILFESYYRETSANLFAEFTQNLDKSKKKDPEESKKIKDRVKMVENMLKSYLSDDSAQINPNFPKVLVEAALRLKYFLNNPIHRELRVEARNLCEHFKIPLDLPKMLSLSVDGITDDEVVPTKENLIILIGPTGSGKSTLANVLAGVKFTLAEDDEVIRLVPATGQKVQAAVGYGWSSQTLYPQKIRNNELTSIDLSGFRDTRESDRGICAALGLPLTIDGLKTCTLNLLTETDLKDKILADQVPALIQMNSGAYEIMLHNNSPDQREKLQTETIAKQLKELFEANKISKKASLSWDHPIIKALTEQFGYKNPKTARCAVIVIPYNAFDPKADFGREGRIRELALNLSQLFKDPLQLARDGKLVFVLSKPPGPKRGKPFNTAKLHKQFRESLADLRNNHAEAFGNLELNKTKLINLEKTIKILEDSINQLQALTGKENLKMEITGLKSIFYKALGDKDKLDEGNISLFIKDQIKKWEDYMSAEAIAFLEPAMRKILSVDPGKKNAQDLEIANQIKMLQSQQEKLDAEYKKLKEELDNDLSLKLILDIIDTMPKGLNNVFIFRGYDFDLHLQIKGDQPDDCKNLMEHFQMLSRNSAEITHNEFIFDPKSQEFKKVVEWAKVFSAKMNPIMEGMCSLPKTIFTLKEQIGQIEAEIKSDKSELEEQITACRSPKVGCDLRLMEEDQVPAKLRSEHAPALIRKNDGDFDLIISQENIIKRIAAPKEISTEMLNEFFEKHKSSDKVFLHYDVGIMDEIIKKANHKPSFKEIEDLAAGIKKKTLDLSKISGDILELQKQIRDLEAQKKQIEDAPAVEHGTQRIFEARGPLGCLGWTTWKYQFPQDPMATIPIERVEMSYCATDENKLVFKTPFVPSDDLENISNYITIDPTTGVRRHEGLEIIDCASTHNKGNFEFTRITDLQRGILAIEYQSKMGIDGNACVRVFVLPKYLPRNRILLSSIQNNLSSNTIRLKSLMERCNQLQISLNQDKKYLDLLESKMRVNQEASVFRIKTLLHRLDYTKESFIKDFISKVPGIEWIEKNENFEILTKLLPIFEQISIAHLKKALDIDFNMEKRTYSTILLGSSPNSPQLIPKQSVSTLLNVVNRNLPKGLYKSLYTFVTDTGLSIASIRELLLWDLKKFEGVPSPRQLAKVKEKCNEYQYIHQILRKEFSRFSSNIEALRKISGVLNLNPGIIGNYLSYLDTIDAQNRLMGKSLEEMQVSGKTQEIVIKTITENSNKVAFYLDKYKITLDVLLDGAARSIEAIRSNTPTNISSNLSSGPKSGLLFSASLSNSLGFSLGVTQGARPSYMDVNSLPDGNCAFNSVVLGVWKLIEDNKLNPNIYIPLAEGLNIPLHSGSEARKEVFNVLSAQNSETRQKTLAPLFRKWSIDYIKNNIKYYQETYYAGLVNACYQYVTKGMKDETYCVHKFIIEKFELIKKEFKENLGKNELDEKVIENLRQWWIGKAKEEQKEKEDKLQKEDKPQNVQNTGLDQYLDVLKQKALSGSDVSRWGGEVEIDAIASKLEITIKNRNKLTGTTQLLGLGYGIVKKRLMLSKFRKPQELKDEHCKQLDALLIGTRCKGGIKITIPDRETIDKIFEIKFSKKERTAVFDDKGVVKKGVLDYILAYQNDKVLPIQIPGIKDTDMASFCKKLAAAGVFKPVLTADNKPGLSPEANPVLSQDQAKQLDQLKYCYAKSPETLFYIMKPVSKNLKNKVFNDHIPDVPCFEVSYAFDHWTYEKDKDSETHNENGNGNKNESKSNQDAESSSALKAGTNSAANASNAGSLNPSGSQQTAAQQPTVIFSIHKTQPQNKSSNPPSPKSQNEQQSIDLTDVKPKILEGGSDQNKDNGGNIQNKEENKNVSMKAQV